MDIKNHPNYYRDYMRKRNGKAKEPNNDLAHWVQIQDHINKQYRLTCPDCTLDTEYYTLDAAKYFADLHEGSHQFHFIEIWEHDEVNE